MKWRKKEEQSQTGQKSSAAVGTAQGGEGGVLRGCFGPFCHPQRVEMTSDVLLKKLRVVGHRLDSGRCLDGGTRT